MTDASATLCLPHAHFGEDIWTFAGFTLLCPAANRRGHYAMLLRLTSDVCLERTSGLCGRLKLNWHRSSPRHMWHRHHFQGQEVKGQGHQAALLPGRVGASGSCNGGRGNVLAVRNCCYVAVCSAARGASAPMGEERGGTYRGGRPPTACCYRDSKQSY